MVTFKLSRGFDDDNYPPRRSGCSLSSSIMISIRHRRADNDRHYENKSVSRKTPRIESRLVFALR